MYVLKVIVNSLSFSHQLWIDWAWLFESLPSEVLFNFVWNLAHNIISRIMHIIFCIWLAPARPAVVLLDRNLVQLRVSTRHHEASVPKVVITVNVIVIHKFFQLGSLVLHFLNDVSQVMRYSIFCCGISSASEANQKGPVWFTPHSINLLSQQSTYCVWQECFAYRIKANNFSITK